MQQKFAFLVHPRTCVQRDMAGWFAPLGLIPEPIYRWGLRTLPIPPVTAGTVTLRNQTESTAGSIIMVPLSAQQMLQLPRAQVMQRVIAAVDHAAASGAQLVGLGALTAPVTAGGTVLAQRTDIGVTNGNAFTAAMMHAAARDLIARCPHADPTIAIIGAAGSVGSCVARLLAQSRACARLLLVGRRLAPVAALADEIAATTPRLTVTPAVDVAAARSADLVIVLTSASDSIVRAEHLKPGAMVLDGTQPRNTDADLLTKRPDVLVVDGGLVAVPSVRISVQIGLPRGCVYACLAETMLLALDGHRGHFTLGAPTLEQATYISQLAQKYRHLGFTLAPFHTFGQSLAADPVTVAATEAVGRHLQPVLHLGIGERASL